MKANFNFPLLRLAFAVLLFAGCATNRVDWDSRVGVFTYDQAVKELGRPNKVEPLAKGRFTAQWISRYPLNNNMPGLDNNFYTHSASFSGPPEYRESKLSLTFATNNILDSWSWQ